MKKLISVFVVLVLFSLFLLPVGASAEENQWTLIDDGKTLIHGFKEYEPYNNPPDWIYFPEGDIYLYELAYSGDTYEHEYVSVVPSDTDIVKLHFNETVYVTKEGKEKLDRFKNGEYSSYLLCYEHNIVKPFEYSDFSSFMIEENLTEIDVTTVWNSDIFEVRAFDASGIFAHNCGAVYRIENDYYYVHYDTLPNSFFDAYGGFSYRQGIVPAYKLNDSSVQFVESARFSSLARNENYVYPEEKAFLGEDDNAAATVTFWSLIIMFGFIVPAVPFVLSVIFANTKKVVNKKRWYFLTVASALWILSTVGILLSLYHR